MGSVNGTHKRPRQDDIGDGSLTSALARKKSSPPTLYPEYTKPGGVKYIYRELEFWTSGFFPGSLHALLERQRKFNHILHRPGTVASTPSPHRLQLEFACKWWTENLHPNGQLKGTHDLGFMIAPWARRQWELNHDARAFSTMVEAAKTLAARYNPTVGCMRSWDTCQTKIYSFKDPSEDFLVIIDNMMNLDLVFYVATQTNNPEMFDIAISHARVTQRQHVRPDFTTTHVINFDQATGEVKQRLTNQGLAHESCWTRGQAWAIAGFAETYGWTGDLSFLQTARDCADYFVSHLPETYVPPWDFHAPTDQPQPTDTSAALIAAYGMLLIHEALTRRREASDYLTVALKVVNAVCERHVNPPARFTAQRREVETVEHGVSLESGVLSVDLGQGETIVSGATINNFEFAPRRWADHGLVYADYFFLLVGNKLLEMGIGELVIRGKPE
ncbi:glycoside hydrolase family 88 protein [Thozetella sp. PMI_491]|nr:glycoside hydrolase family 88 protein [Thozetella sp. PMI_491]